MKSALKSEMLGNGCLRIVHECASRSNAFGEPEAEDLAQVLRRSTEARAVLWTSGTARHFCAGGDLKAHGSLKNKASGIKQALFIRKTLAKLAAWSIPKAVYVGGDCFGGGMELLSCFDFRTAAPHVLFGFWQRRIGLSFGWGGYRRWAQQVSTAELKDLLWSAAPFGSAEALSRNLIHTIARDEDAARLWLKETLRWSEASGRTVGQLTSASEARLFARLWWSTEHREALERFRRK